MVITAIINYPLKNYPLDGYRIVNKLLNQLTTNNNGY